MKISSGMSTRLADLLGKIQKISSPEKKLAAGVGARFTSVLALSLSRESPKNIDWFRSTQIL